MNIHTFIRTENEIETSVFFTSSTTSKQGKPNKPQRFFVLLILLLAFGIGTPYMIKNLSQPKQIVVLSDEEKLEKLIEKVLDGDFLSESEWNELCRLIRVVKGIDVKACDECRNYLKALLGGKHYKHLEQYKNHDEKQIKKGIKSYENQIQLHKNKIKKPENFITNWNDLDFRRREALVNKKWNEDIKRLQEQKEILECILKNRIP